MSIKFQPMIMDYGKFQVEKYNTFKDDKWKMSTDSFGIPRLDHVPRLASPIGIENKIKITINLH